MSAATVGAAPPAPLGAARSLRRVALNLAGLVVFVVMIFPVYWMVCTAFKPGVEISSYTPKWIPDHPTLVHFTDAIRRAGVLDRPASNSVIVVSVVVALSVALAFLAAVALAKYRFTGRRAFIVLVIMIQMLPANALIIPLYVVLARYHQVNQLSGLIVTYLTFVLPFSIWVLRGFILGIPRDLEEAAMVDGNSRFTRLREDPAAARRARASSRRRSSRSSRPGTSSSSPTSCSRAPRSRR